MTRNGTYRSRITPTFLGLICASYVLAIGVGWHSPPFHTQLLNSGLVASAVIASLTAFSTAMFRSLPAGTENGGQGDE